MGNTHIISNTLELIDAIQGCNCEETKQCRCVNVCGVPNYIIKDAEDEQAKPRKLIKKKYKPSKLPPPIQIEPSSSSIDAHSPSVDELIARVEPVQPRHHSFAYSWPSLSSTGSSPGSSSISECSPLSLCHSDCNSYSTVDMNTPKDPMTMESPLTHQKAARVPKFADEEGTNWDSQLIFNFADRVEPNKEGKDNKKRKNKNKNKNKRKNKPRRYHKRNNTSMY